MIDFGRGACRGIDSGVFVRTDRAAETDAKGVCSDCAMKIECLAFSFTIPHLDGVWGGLTARERGFATGQ